MCRKIKLSEIGEFIKKIRIKNNLSFKELSLKTGLSIYKIKKIESGNYDFSLNDFDKIKNTLNIDFMIMKY